MTLINKDFLFAFLYMDMSTAIFFILDYLYKIYHCLLNIVITRHVTFANRHITDTRPYFTYMNKYHE